MSRKLNTHKISFNILHSSEAMPLKLSAHNSVMTLSIKLNFKYKAYMLSYKKKKFYEVMEHIQHNWSWPFM